MSKIANPSFGGFNNYSDLLAYNDGVKQPAPKKPVAAPTTPTVPNKPTPRFLPSDKNTFKDIRKYHKNSLDVSRSSSSGFYFLPKQQPGYKNELAVNLLNHTGRNVPNGGVNKQRYDAMAERIQSARAAREKAGVPAKLSDKFMSYAPAKVDQYVDHASGMVFPVKGTPKKQVLPDIDPAFYIPHYNLLPDNGRAYAAGWANSGAMSKADFKSRVASHEGLLPMQGHLGTQNFDYDFGTAGYPIVNDAMLKGLPRFSMSNASVGGDLGGLSYNYYDAMKEQHRKANNGQREAHQGPMLPSSDQLGPLMHTYLQSATPLTGDDSADRLAGYGSYSNESGGTNGYSTSAGEFTADFSNIKHVAAHQLVKGVNTFDPDNPDVTINAINRLKNDKQHQKVLYDNVHQGSVDGILRQLNRYKYLHDKSMSGEGLSRTEGFEYRHLRKVLPPMINQSKVIDRAPNYRNRMNLYNYNTGTDIG